MTMTDEGYEDFEDFMQGRLSDNDSNSADQSLGGEDSMAEKTECKPPHNDKNKGSEDCGKVIIKEARDITINVDCRVN